ncbi:MAG: ThuA domain-containing protein [Bacteroidota bacterium]
MLGLVRFCALMVGLLLTTSPLAGQGQFRALLITETDGWHHESIVAGIPALEGLAERHDFQLDRFQSGQTLTEAALQNYQVVIFLNTTRDIFNEEEEAAFEKFIQAGNGFVGIHAASDTEYEWEWFTQLVGRMFRIHPAVQTAWVDLETRKFPGLERWPDRLMWTDEYYDFTEEKVEGLTYLLSVDESTYDPQANWGSVATEGMGDFHPLSWYHHFDGGRSFYTALGHLPAIYEEPLFLEHIYGGIFWAATGKGLPE